MRHARAGTRQPLLPGWRRSVLHRVAHTEDGWDQGRVGRQLVGIRIISHNECDSAQASRRPQRAPGGVNPRALPCRTHSARCGPVRSRGAGSATRRQACPAVNCRSVKLARAPSRALPPPPPRPRRPPRRGARARPPPTRRGRPRGARRRAARHRFRVGAHSRRQSWRAWGAAAAHAAACARAAWEPACMTRTLRSGARCMPSRGARWLRTRAPPRREHTRRRKERPVLLAFAGDSCLRTDGMQAGDMEAPCLRFAPSVRSAGRPARARACARWDASAAAAPRCAASARSRCSRCRAPASSASASAADACAGGAGRSARHLPRNS